MNREQTEKVASQLRQNSSAEGNCVHLAYAMIQYFSQMRVPEFVSEEDCDLNTYAVEIAWDDFFSVLKTEEGTEARSKKKKRSSKKCITQSRIVNASPFEQLMPAQKVKQIALGDDGEIVEEREVYDFGGYSQSKSIYSEISNELMKLAATNYPVKVSFGKINLGRTNPKALGHMIAYFATPDFVWYIDLQKIMGVSGNTVSTSIEELFKFSTRESSGNRNTADLFSPYVFFVPIGPVFSAKTTFKDQTGETENPVRDSFLLNPSIHNFQMDFE